MQENVGEIDRAVRFAVGGLLVVGAVRSLIKRRSVGAAMTLAAGAVIVESAITRVCPINALLGVDTRQFDSDAKQLRLSAGNLHGDRANGRLRKDDAALRLGYES
jgi:hypothetical protein